MTKEVFYDILINVSRPFLIIKSFLLSLALIRMPLYILINISRPFLIIRRLEYYQYLQKIRDEGDWESWLKFFLRGVNEVAQEATATARKIVQLRENHRSIIAANIPLRVEQFFV